MIWEASDEKPVSRNGAVDKRFDSGHPASGPVQFLGHESGRIIQHWATSRIHPSAFSAIVSFRPCLAELYLQQDPSLSFGAISSPPHSPPPPLLLPPFSLLLVGRLPGCLCGRQPQCTLYTVHCTCAVYGHSTALLLLPQSRQARTGVTYSPRRHSPLHWGSARSGTTHKCRLALCLKQGFW